MCGQALRARQKHIFTGTKQSIDRKRSVGSPGVGGAQPLLKRPVKRRRRRKARIASLQLLTCLAAERRAGAQTGSGAAGPARSHPTKSFDFAGAPRRVVRRRAVQPGRVCTGSPAKKVSLGQNMQYPRKKGGYAKGGSPPCLNELWNGTR